MAEIPISENGHISSQDTRQGHSNSTAVDKEANYEPPPPPRNVHGIAVRMRRKTLSDRTVAVLTFCPQWALVVLSTLSCILLYALDNTITANLIPVIHPNVLQRSLNSNATSRLSRMISQTRTS